MRRPRRGENSLEEFSSAGALENGDGSGEVVDDALRLEYDDAGWFCSNVRADRSDETHLELVVRGDDGGEEDDVYLEIDDVEAPLSELTSDSIGTDFDTVSVDLEAAAAEAADVGVRRVPPADTRECAHERPARAEFDPFGIW